VLSLPATWAERDLLRVMTFGVVLFTLLVKGTTTSYLLRRLGLVGRGKARLEYERRHGQLMAARAALDAVGRTIVREYVDHCLGSPDTEEAREKIVRIVELFLKLA